jgi:hypothetical protein
MGWFLDFFWIENEKNKEKIEGEGGREEGGGRANE